MNTTSRLKLALSGITAVVLVTVSLPALAADIPASPDGTVRAVAAGLAIGIPRSSGRRFRRPTRRTSPS